MSDWIEVRAVFLEPPQDWSLYVDCFVRRGCAGTLQDEAILSAYVADIPGAGAQVAGLQSELLSLGAHSVETSVVPDQDWSELWKVYFKPRRVGARFMLVPSWEVYDALPDDLVITLDPGQAFGTGDHPTTRLCLRLMEKVGLIGAVLDVGCGSGVLAIGASLLGAHSVRATDIDPQAVEITRANAVLNKVVIGAECMDGFASGAQYDLVLSNIISATLIRLSPEASLAVQAGGHWIVSGIIEQNWNDVLAAAERVGFSLVEVEKEDDWVGAIFRR